MRSDYRQDELQAAGIDRESIAMAYAELRDRERLQRAWKWEVRGAFFGRTGAGTGQAYKARHRAAFRDGDMSALPSFDLLAASMAEDFPELAGDDCAQRLFDLIAEGVDRMPSREDTYRAAVDMVLDNPAPAAVGVDDCSAEY